MLRLRVMELMVMRLGRGRVLLFMERGWRRGEDMVVVWDGEISGCVDEILARWACKGQF